MLYIKTARLVLVSVHILLSIVGMMSSCSSKESPDKNIRKIKTQEAKAQRMKNQEVVKVGVLFSLTGNMALSEVSSRDAVLMAIEEINDDGGLLGKKIEPVVLDPHSTPSYYPVLAYQLFTRHHVNTIFGCSTTQAGTSLLKVLKNNRGLLFYPGPHEGREKSENIVYLGASPEQQLIPAVSYLLNAPQGAFDKFYLVGPNDSYTHNINNIIKAFLQQKGIPENSIRIKYTAANQENFEEVISDIKRFSTAGKACVLSSITGRANLAFYKEFTSQGLSSASCPIMAFSVAEDEFRQMKTEFFTGHLSAKNYFQSVDSDKNIRFVSSFKLFCAIHELPEGVDRVTSDAICWAYTGVQMWRKAVEKANSFDNEKVKQALYGIEYNSPAGIVRMSPDNLQLGKPVFIGESKPDGQFEVVWRSGALVTAATQTPLLLHRKRQKKETKAIF